MIISNTIGAALNITVFDILPSELPINPVPSRGNFACHNFLKVYYKCYRMSHVCTLIVGDG